MSARRYLPQSPALHALRVRSTTDYGHETSTLSTYDHSIDETETRQAEELSGVVEIRVPGLTVLYHPNLDRVGERALLTDLATGATRALSRHEPGFARPGDHHQRGLDDASISRQPIRLMPGESAGSIAVSTVGSRTTLVVEGQPIPDRATCSAADIERGVVLLLGGRIVLFLHLLDPLSSTAPAVQGLIGESLPMAQARREIKQVADLLVPVLLRGETGTGKEIVARAIHDASPRRSGPFVAVNMAAIPAPLAAAELFGAAKGAYTGAQRARRGHFQNAEGGTLFLDEIGEAPTEIQTLLLRALETREIQPVGTEQPQKVDVRVISATDRDLEAAAREQGFRSPLLYRLAGFTLRLPPLRHRREDFGRLFVAFLRRELSAIDASDRLALRDGAQRNDGPWIPAALVARLAAHDWPGNVRQLANVTRQLVIANRGVDRVRMPASMDTLIGQASPGALPAIQRTTEAVTTQRPASAAPKAGPRKPVEIHEDELIRCLRANRWRLQDTADQLGIARTSLYHLIARSRRVQKASDLSREQIEASQQAHAGSIARMADAFEVSERALRRRMGQLRIPI